MVPLRKQADAVQTTTQREDVNIVLAELERQMHGLGLSTSALADEI